MLLTFAHGKSRIANPFATSRRAPEPSPTTHPAASPPTVDAILLVSRRHQFLNAVKLTVPQSMWGAIVERLNQVEHHPDALDVEIADFDDGEDALDPTEFAEGDEGF